MTFFFTSCQMALVVGVDDTDLVIRWYFHFVGWWEIKGGLSIHGTSLSLVIAIFTRCLSFPTSFWDSCFLFLFRVIVTNYCGGIDSSTIRGMSGIRRCYLLVYLYYISKYTYLLIYSSVENIAPSIREDPSPTMHL